MKRIINGRKYNTETSTLLAQSGGESLYRSPAHRYFITAGDEIIPLDLAGARAWADTRMEPEQTAALFLVDDLPEDNEPRELLGLSISATTAAALRRASAIYKLPMSRLLDKAVIDAYGDLDQAP